MGWPKLLALVRHAESVGNTKTPDERAEFECATYSYPLTERGRKQASITGDYVRSRFPKGFDAHYTSYYERAKETMRIMIPRVKIYEDPRLAEAQRGIYHTMTKAKLCRRFPEELKRKDREGLYHYRPLGGESWPDVELRIHSFLGTLNRDYDGQSVIIVVHGHWLILFQRLVQHFSIDEAIRRYEAGVVPNASVTVYSDKRVRGKSRLVLLDENVVPWRGIV